MSSIMMALAAGGIDQDLCELAKTGSMKEFEAAWAASGPDYVAAQRAAKRWGAATPACVVQWACPPGEWPSEWAALALLRWRHPGAEPMRTWIAAQKAPHQTWSKSRYDIWQLCQ